MRVESAVTSLSWIPSEAVTGMLKLPFTLQVSAYDDPPPDVVDDDAVLADAYAVRFANRLRGWADFGPDGTATAHGIDGGVVMGRTTARLGPVAGSFAAVAMPVLRATEVGGAPTGIDVGPGWVRFRQTCGGRTAAPLPRRIPRAPWVRMQAPLVWTTLELVLHADGRTEHQLTGASGFPRHWVYDATGALSLKAGRTDWSGWTGQVSPGATPWGEEDSPVVVTAAETALERELSTLIMRGGRRPAVRTLPAGAVLARQGEPGDALFLLLDGVLEVDVDGGALTELGPGAVLGERAVLEGGRRTATLTAVTPVRVAQAAADTLDRTALAALAAGHRRERSGREESGGR
ncbi:cyclic nucleotide-binding domain-containing protein [Pseudonocardia saturnea]